MKKGARNGEKVNACKTKMRNHDAQCSPHELSPCTWLIKFGLNELILLRAITSLKSLHSGDRCKSYDACVYGVCC